MHDIRNPDPTVYINGRGLCLDIETTNLGKGDARFDNHIVCFSYQLFGTVPRKWAEPQRVVSGVPDYTEGLLTTLIEEEDYDFLIVHGGKFELKYFIKLGIDVSRLVIYDTMLVEKIIASNRRWPLNLGEVNKRYGGTGKDSLVDVLIKNGVCPSTIPESLLSKRVSKDVKDTLQVYQKQIEILQRDNLLNVAYTKCMFSPVVADMEMNGMYLDAELVRSMYTEDNRRLNELTAKLDEITGGINFNSPKQLAEFIYGDLKFKVPMKYGKPLIQANNLGKTDIETLGLLMPKTKRQKAFLEAYREASKVSSRISKYYNQFIAAIDENDGYLWGSINQEITVTQRLSSSNPNLQNIDRGLKKVITTRREGWRIRQNDYAQLEFRVAGFLSQCPVALADILNKEDVHRNTALILFEDFEQMVPGSKEYAERRSQAKADTFKPLYGGEKGSPEQEEYYEFFKRKYHGITKWQRNLMTEALSNNTVTMNTGLKFYFPGVRRMENGNVTNHTNIKNYPVQYFATGEIAVIGTMLLWHEMKKHKLQSFLVNEVHDSAVMEQHPDEHEILEELSHKAMEDDTIQYIKNLYGVEINYPITIDTEVHTNWGYNKE